VVSHEDAILRLLLALAAVLAASVKVASSLRALRAPTHPPAPQPASVAPQAPVYMNASTHPPAPQATVYINPNHIDKVIVLDR
jgi:hypothetical protein